ncbi:MAG: hypothetical protein IKR61_09430 [Lachnospiraceae bacterium]|nr:hypothetical protein [Lachnospiraceae bacterium]
MANAFYVYSPFEVPAYVTEQIVERVSQVAPYRKYERDRKEDTDKRKREQKFAKVLEDETSRRRYETGDVSEISEIGDPGFFFDYKM